jgi:hypothetical protein
MMESPARKTRCWRMPSIAQGAVGYLVALLLALSFRHVVLGEDRTTSQTISFQADLDSIIESDDPYKCKALMTEGEWYHSHTWLAPGCDSRPYGVDEINSCFNNHSRVVIAGDASVQGLFWSIALAVDGRVKRQGPVESNLRYSNPNLELRYLYDPFLHGSEVLSTLEAYRDEKPNSPSIMVVGTGRWHAANDAVQEFAGAIDRVAGIAHSSDTRISLGKKPLSAKQGPGNLLLFAPLQQPYSGHPLTDPKLEIYRQLNGHLQQRYDEGAIDVTWAFTQMTEGRRDKLIKDGPAVVDEVSRKQAEVVLALRCNAKIAAKGHFPNTRTCCANWRKPNWIQAGFLMLALAVLPAIVMLDLVRPVFSDKARPVLRAFSGFTAMIALQYASDRTHLFDQVKRLDLVDHNLKAMLVLIALVGLVSIRRSKPPKKKPSLGSSNSNHPVENNQPFLSRDQTNEWKGWMQALIIAYHYNKAWTALWFWEIIRLAVSSYLFLTGFGHTLFFLQKEDYSFRRVAGVLIRTNLLPVTLAYVMRTRWLLYYYMPLSTFWFLVVYATLAIAPGLNKNRLTLVCKILASATLVRTFITTHDLPETFVRLLTLTFGMSFDARAFFDYRVRIDEYVVYVGMLSAVLYLWLQEILSLSPSSSQRRRTHDNKTFSETLRRMFPHLQIATPLLAALTLATFWYRIHASFTTTADWAAWQSILGPIPILCFIVLRNSHPVLRNYHSAAFAWLGKYSGEMYTMQNHIWLAGDQESVLGTGFFRGGDGTLRNDRWRDLVVLTPVYLVVCWVVGEATGVIANWFLDEEEKDEGGRRQVEQLGGGTSSRPNNNHRKRTHGRAASTSSAVEMGLLAGENFTSSSSSSSSSSFEEDAYFSEKHTPHQSSPPGLLRRVIQGGCWPGTVWGRAVLTLGVLWAMNLVYT